VAKHTLPASYNITVCCRVRALINIFLAMPRCTSRIARSYGKHGVAVAYLKPLGAISLNAHQRIINASRHITSYNARI